MHNKIKNLKTTFITCDLKHKWNFLKLIEKPRKKKRQTTCDVWLETMLLKFRTIFFCKIQDNTTATLVVIILLSIVLSLLKKYAIYGHGQQRRPLLFKHQNGITEIRSLKLTPKIY